MSHLPSEHDIKPDVAHDEATTYPTLAGKAESEAYVDTYVEGTDEEKRLVRKIDRHMLPMLWVMYIMNVSARLLAAENALTSVVHRQNQHRSESSPDMRAKNALADQKERQIRRYGEGSRTFVL